MKAIAITGANGLLGSALVGQLKENGDFFLLRLVRNPKEANEFYFDLKEPLNDTSFLRNSKVDILVLAAWNMRNGGDRFNVSGSIELCKIAFESGVKVVFISSMSSFPGCVSEYGRNKFEVETYVLNNAGWVIRPGLIWGWGLNGGIFSKLNNIVQKYKIIPTIAIKSGLHMVEINQLVSVIGGMLKDLGVYPPGIYTIASPERLTVESIQRRCAKHYKLKRFFVPINWRFLFFLLKTSECIGINLPFKSDSLIGLVNSDQNPVLSFDKFLSDFE